MPQPSPLPYGSWPSPITGETLTAETVQLSETSTDGETLYWLEGRPGEGGRTALVRQTPDGHRADAVPAPFNVRSRVHEYGGGAYTVHDGVVCFTHFADQRIYLLDTISDAAPRPLTPEGGLRYGGLRADPAHDRVLAVREDHSDPGGEPVNTLVAIPLGGAQADGGQVLFSGTDFVSAPAVDVTGTRLAWVSWDHPNMPWDDTTLWVAEVRPDGGLADVRAVAGEPGVSVGEPRWLPDGRLCFLSDRTGWTNLYALDVGTSSAPVALFPDRSDFGAPRWTLGASSYAPIDETRLVCTWTSAGIGGLGVLDLDTGTLTRIAEGASLFGWVSLTADSVVCCAGFPTQASAVLTVALSTGEESVVRRATTFDVASEYLSSPEPVQWPNSEGKDVYGFYFAPGNPQAVGPPGATPPLVVFTHGGPTGAVPAILDPQISYFTSRGLAVLAVNYGGSVGYGRAYRHRLRGRWGIVDVDDCATGAQAMAERGLADPDRLVIRGGSAGGFTTLAALTNTSVFAAGASYYGVGDLEALARDTHKFESRYLDGLVGRYPQDREVYLERSPVHHTDRLSAPMILLQGSEDKVVPPEQARSMADAVRAKGLPVTLLMFDGEGHGFRSAAAVRRSVEAELEFYGEVLGFAPAAVG